MKVFVVYHADLEDDRYVRLVFADEGMADRAVGLDEPDWVTRVDGEVVPRHHGEWCCTVEEYEVLTAWPEVMHGPPSKYQYPPRQPSALEQQLHEMFIKQLTAPSLFEMFKLKGLGNVDVVSVGLHTEKEPDAETR